MSNSITNSTLTKSSDTQQSDIFVYLKEQILTGSLNIFLLVVRVICLSAAAILPASAAVDYAGLYEKISSSVVTVDTQTIAVTETGIQATPGIGTGFLITPTLIMTAAHVVVDADFIQVRFTDGSRIGANLIATDNATDAALLELESAVENPVTARLGDSGSAKIGSSVFIVGAPFGIEQTLSVGYLSGRREKGELEDGTTIEYLQTDTAINPGNSGGPMFNAQGEVIGIVSFILTKSGGFDGVGFASAINSAYDAVINSSAFRAGFEGLKLTAEQARALSIPDDGILIQRVVEGSFSHELGLRAGTIPANIAGQDLVLGGDVILELQCQDCPEHGFKEVSSVVAQFTGDRTLNVKVFRDGQVIKLSNEKPSIQVATTSFSRVDWHP